MTELMENRTAVLLMAIFGITAGPLCEELGFRGLLQPLLVRSLGAFPGIVLTAIPFGLLHFREYGNSLGYAALVSLAGVGFGWMRHAHRLDQGVNPDACVVQCVCHTGDAACRGSAQSMVETSSMVETIQWLDGAVVMIDQTRLPLEERW